MSLNMNGVGHPLAIINGGEYDKKIVYLNDDQDKEHEKDFISMTLKRPDIFQTVPNTKIERQIHYVSGSSGAGKSTWINNFIKQYRKSHPTNKIYLLSKLSSDPSIDMECVNRIILNEKMYEDPLNVHDFKNSLVIADDIDTIKKPKLLKDAIQLLLDEILTLGRHDNVSCIISSHDTTRGRDSKTIINECHTVTLFLKSSATYDYFLKTYFNYSNKQIIKLRAINSRFITIYRGYPNVILGEQFISIADDFLMDT